ncbi:hypothetical protein QR721_11280 [Aciduricibacillus chroicocephali]|uniref:LHH domain-containing protein n=1 Tax=Aciduricibacillus chroicocephali TaxID=3054939 RepID=A0ABY9KVD2_9BACI|nr:hypothetical protein QR721_11280 [Bacillaceae bacterium 44XB]
MKDYLSQIQSSMPNPAWSIEPGSMVELPSSMHKEYDKILHGLVENRGSFRSDPVLKKNMKTLDRNIGDGELNK